MTPETQHQPGTLLRHKSVPVFFVYLEESDTSVLVLSPRTGRTVSVDKLYVYECYEAASFEEEDK